MIKPDLRKDRIHSKTLTTVDHLLTKDNIRDTISEVIRVQDDITDLICVFRTRNGGFNLVSVEVDVERAVYLLDKARRTFHEGQEILEGGSDESSLENT